MNKKLMKKIDDFIKDKRKSDGGYSEVKEGDVQKLDEIINELCSLKYEKDPDGDIPINWNIVDRTKYEQPCDVNVPYLHKDKAGHFSSIISNLSYFSSRLDRLSKHIKIED